MTELSTTGEPRRAREDTLVQPPLDEYAPAPEPPSDSPARPWPPSPQPNRRRGIVLLIVVLLLALLAGLAGWFYGVASSSRSDTYSSRSDTYSRRSNSVASEIQPEGVGKRPRATTIGM